MKLLEQNYYVLQHYYLPGTKVVTINTILLEKILVRSDLEFWYIYKLNLKEGKEIARYLV